ncbi:MAG TPA: ATP-binding protein [Candidatus Angelobacter sp.]|nr:ATP-binding protein [Candidatus Angelobacter sp.]
MSTFVGAAAASSSDQSRRVLTVDDPSLNSFVSDARSGKEIEVVTTTLEDFLPTALRDRFDLIVTSPLTSASDDIELLAALQKKRGETVKVIILVPAATPAEVIAALRAHAFALFSMPFDYGSFAAMVEAALSAPVWSDCIEVVSAKPEWISLRVRCSMVAAERLVQYGRELKVDLTDDVRSNILHSFRELLMNAMEHGGRFNPTLKVDVGYLRTDTAILYYIRDPGAGFDTEQAMANARAAAQDPLACVAARIVQGLRPGGFGIHLASQMIDSLIYNQFGDEVVLFKNLR